MYLYAESESGRIGRMTKIRNIYLFRHGESTWNIEGRCQGNLPGISPLTEKGRDDAKTIVPKLKDKGISLIISSDLLRAKETAEIVGKNLDVPVEYDIRLQEINFGKAQGLIDEEIKEKFPNFINALRSEHDDVLAETGESINQCRQRMESFLRDALQKHPNEIIAISAHGTVIGNFIGKIDGQEFIKLKNAEVVALTYNGKVFEYKGKIE